jgi:hypothetical protein
VAAPALAQSGLDAPRIGYLRDATGAVRPLLGVRGNFLLSDPILSEARSSAFGSSGGIIKTSESILFLDSNDQLLSRIESPPGEALFALARDGRPMAAYFPLTSELHRLEGQSLVNMACSFLRPDEPVRALSAPAHGELSLAVARGEAIWLVTIAAADCEILSETLLPGVTGSLALLPDSAIVYAGGQETVLRRSSMSETRFPLPAAAIAVELAGPGWVHVRCEDGSSWGLYVETEPPELFRLPGEMR